MGKVKYNAGATITMPAGSDLSASQYLCVKNDGSGGAVISSTATDAIIGTIKVPCAAGYVSGSAFDAVEIFPRSAPGTILAIAAGSISVGAFVTATTGGKVTGTTNSGDQIVGIYIGSAAAAANDIIEIMPSTGKY